MNKNIKTRLLLAAGVFVELALLAVMGLLVFAGGIQQSPVAHALLVGMLLALALALTLLPSLSNARGVVLHGALLLGSLLFMFPFVWLVSTSFKYPEEIVEYPPRWVPAMPPGVSISPYVSGDLFDDLQIPAEFDDARFAELFPGIEGLLWNRASILIAPAYLEQLDLEAVREVIVPALWNTITPAMPADIWGYDDGRILETLAERVTRERVEDIWSSIYRCVALGVPFVTDMEQRDHLVSLTVRDMVHEHMETTENMRSCVLPRNLASDGEMAQIAYTLSGRAVGTVTLELPLPVEAAELRSVTLPLRQDRSWRRIGVTLEVDGRRHESRGALFLGWYRWQELTFKLAVRDDVDERDLGIWPLMPARHQEDVYDRPGFMKLRLHLYPSSRAAAVMNKYLQSYRNAWIAGKHWDRYISNSVYLVVMTMLGQMVSCSMVAYAFSRLRWPGRDPLFFVLLATMMLPGQVTMVPVFLVFRWLGWYNTLKPLWVPAFAGAPFFIFLLRQFMKGIPRELEEAALIDGAGYFGIYARIILPLVKPALAAVGIFTFMGTWNEFMGPLIYINDQRLYPLALGLFEFRAQFGGDFGMLMAASTMMILPVIIIFFFAQKYFIQGVTLTGMKN